MKNKKYKISLVINIIIFILTVIASIIMFTGFKFMHGLEPELETTTLGMFKFFTVDSNILMGIAALIFSVEEIKILKKKMNEINKEIYILKLLATVGVSLTFLVVFAYLGPISKGGIKTMLMNSNLFFHLIIPVLSIINFVFFEKTNKLDFKYTFFGLSPTIAYGVFYTSNVILHIENGKVSTKYDWYWFAQNGLWTIPITIILMLVITYIISLILWKSNKMTLKK